MRSLVVSCLLVLLSICVNAQSTPEEQKVGAAVEQLRLAMISGEKAALEQVVAAALSYGHSGGKIEDRSTFIESITSGKSDFVAIELKNQTVKIAGKTALVRHQLHALTNDGGKAGEVNLGILLVWQKEKKQWKLLARQAYKLP